jgi:hypothetical protein
MLERNAALFLIYYGFNVFKEQVTCSEKTQQAIVSVYQKIEKKKYKPFLDLTELLEAYRLRGEHLYVSG